MVKTRGKGKEFREQNESETVEELDERQRNDSKRTVSI